MKYDVISVGSAVLDAFVKAPDLQVLKTDQVKTGEAIIAPYRSKLEVEELVITSGGGGTNTAVGFSRLGLKSGVLARCGWDFAGKLVRKEIKKEGVDDSLLIQKENERTDYSTILIGPDGGRTILVYRGGTRLEKEMIDWQKINASWLAISSIEGNLDLLAALISHAQKNHIKVAVNPGKREIKQKEKLLPFLQKVNLLTLNREEADQLIGKKHAALVSEGVVVVTKGSQGVDLYDLKDKLLQSGGFKMKTVDSTGAGDGFFCGLVAGLAKGWELEKSLKLGVSNGASVVTEIGAKTGLLQEKNLHNWLNKPLKMNWQKNG